MPDRLATFFAVAIPVASRAARPMYPREGAEVGGDVA